MNFLDKLSEKNTVTLAKNLIPNLYKITSNEKVPVTLEEYKLLFTYLSKINPMKKTEIMGTRCGNFGVPTRTFLV